MKALRYGISCLLAAGLASIAACGGSSDDDPAASSGGASQSGGAPGSAGRAPTAGAGSNPACPTAVPADGAACTLSGTQSACSYSGLSCRCARAGGGGMREWDCTATLVCPATKPTVGEACTPAAGSCSYAGMASCSCQSRKWACRGGTTGGGGTGGAFGGFGGGFTGGGGRFGGFSGAPGSGVAGAASGTTCPATKPAADSVCTGTGACPYTGGGCVCSADKWSCL